MHRTPPNQEGPLPSSFRDPSGFVFRKDGVLYRQVNQSYAGDWSNFHNSGLYEGLVRDGLITPVEEAPLGLAATNDAAAIVRPELIPFISYPYEWCFSQLKGAALLTLEIMRRAMAKGQWLKDASNYNVQFLGTKPIHIDSFSFEPYREGEPWPAYGQFCRHFLAPLVASKYLDNRTTPMLSMNLDGFHLDLLSKALPFSTKFKPGIAMHIHMHGRAEASTKALGPRPQISKNALLGIVDSLFQTVASISPPESTTTWSNYYQDNNYAGESIHAKEKLVSEFVDAIPRKPHSCWDLGANTGQFSELVASMGIPTIAFDLDPEVVERAYCKWHSASMTGLSPYIQNLTNPSPRLGWAHQERDSITDRGPADLIMALALIHHLAIANNVPLPSIASWFAQIGKWAIVEFVPKEDSQVVRMLSTRRDIFSHYNREAFELAFGEYFILRRSALIPGTVRSLSLWERKQD